MLIDTPLKSANLVLKNLNEDNANVNYVTWLNNKIINKFTESRFVEHTEESIAQFIESNNRSGNTLLLGIFENDKHIGNIRAFFDWNHKTASIGLIIGAPSSHGKGIGSQSISILSNYLFKEKEIFKINAGLYESNLASLKAFQKAGFDEEYRKKRHVINDDGAREDVIMMVKYAR